MHRNPMPHTNANGSDLAVLYPNSCERFASRRGNAVFGQHFNEQLLEPAQIFMQIIAAPAKIDNGIAHELARSMICCLAATIDREKWMRQMCGPEFAIPTWSGSCSGQTGLIRSAPDCVNRFMLEQKQLVLQRGVVPFPGDDFFLQRQRLREFNSAEPTHIKRTSDGIHICIPPGRPRVTASCARRCVRAIASASAASASGVSVKPRSARTINAT